MVRNFYAELLHDDPDVLEEWRGLAPRVFELSEFIVDVLGVSDLGGPGAGRRVTYHEACHLRRELGVTAQPRALLNAVPGLDLVEMDQAEVCCGFGGTFSVKYPDISGGMLDDKVASVMRTGAQALVSCDMSCLMHIGGALSKRETGVRPMHLAQLLDEDQGP
jgi:L-lactate dehydrogenase complex protein LldE